MEELKTNKQIDKNGNVINLNAFRYDEKFFDAEFHLLVDNDSKDDCFTNYVSFVIFKGDKKLRIRIDKNLNLLLFNKEDKE